MKDTHKTRLVDGIIVMSNPYILFGTIGVMMLVGWIAEGELHTILGVVALAYLILSIVGGSLARSVQKKARAKSLNK